MNEQQPTEFPISDDPQAGPSEDPLALLWSLLGRPIAFHRRLVDVTGTVKAALMLSQAIYWTRHGRDIVQNGGWFFKTSEQWYLETSLTRYEQASARNALIALAVIGEQCRGMPAKLHYRIDLERLGVILCELTGTRAIDVDWDDRAIVAELLGPVVAFHRILAAVGGGATAGLYLSRAVYLTRTVVRKHPDGWLALPAAAWVRDLGLTPREQERARRALRELGVWEERLAGVPPRLYMRVCLTSLVDCLVAEAHDPLPITEPAGACDPDGGNTTNRFSPNQQTRWRDSHHLILRKPANKFAGKRVHSLLETAKLIELKSTRYVLQPLPQDASRLTRAPLLQGSGGGDELIFPASLLAEEREIAASLLRQVPELAQLILDELAARIGMQAIRTSPIGYLRGLVMHALEGAFAPELGPRIAAARRQRGIEQDARHRDAEEEARLKAARASPEYQQQLARRREEVRTMLDAVNGSTLRRRPS